MGPTWLRRLTLLALIAAVGAFAATAVRSRDGPEERAAPARRSAEAEATGALVLGREQAKPLERPPRATPPTADEDLASGTIPGRKMAAPIRASAPVARRFVSALLAFEARGATPHVRGKLEATATASLARFILEREPRRPIGLRPPSRGWLAGLEPLPVRSRGRVELAAKIARGRTQTGLILVLRRRRGAWWVTALH